MQLNDSDLIQRLIKQVDKTSGLSWEERLSLNQLHCLETDADSRYCRRLKRKKVS